MANFQPIVPVLNSLSLRTNNPYSTGRIEVLNSGEMVLTRKTLNYTPQLSDRYYLTVKNTDLTSVAYWAYGDSKLWWLIADANSIMNPLEVSAGIELVIPPIEVLNNY